VLKAVYPIVGVAHDDGQIDYTLRMPQARSLATGDTGTQQSRLSLSSLRDVVVKLRHALGLDRVRPQLRVLRGSNE
jgi:hypothetical protein